jgi:hypothetical protein
MVQGEEIWQGGRVSQQHLLGEPGPVATLCLVTCD